MEPSIYVLEPETTPLEEGRITTKGLLAELTLQDENLRNIPGHFGAFIGLPVNEWMKHAVRLPTVKKLFGPFWFEGEICILFASSNQGKTILAVQIAESISAGKPVLGFLPETEPQGVAYFDFEMSVKQFELRYSTEGVAHHQWSDNFSRYQIYSEAEVPNGFPSFEAYLVHSIEEVIFRTGVRVIIIDNLTYLSNDTETAKSASPLMKQLKELKSRHNLSLLILAHTPKRDSSKPLSPNDLQGSSRLMQFCDSCFAIGPSNQGSDVKYLKQIKVRNTAFEYDADNVIVCEIVKEKSFLRFERTGASTERKLLMVAIENDKGELITRIRDLAASGKTQRQIAEEIGNVSPSKVNRLLKAAESIS